MEMIDLKGVSIYMEGPEIRYPLDDFSFHFADRGLYFVVEKTGSGKSTLLKTIGGFVISDCGSVMVPPRTSFSYVFHGENFLPSLSLRENFELVERNEKKIEAA